MVLVQTKQNMLIVAHVTPNQAYSQEQLAFRNNTYERNDLLISQAVRIANDNQLTLSPELTSKFAILGDSPNYHVYEPNPQKVDGGAVKFDFSDITNKQARSSVVWHVIHDKHLTSNARDIGAERPNEGREDHPFRGIYSADTEILQKIDNIFVAPITYGTDKKTRACFLCSGNEIIKIDSNVAEHSFQGWDDYTDVSQQINNFAQQLGLIIGRGALRGEQTELAINNGKLHSKADVLRGKLTRAEEKQGTSLSTIKFKDGAELHAMSPSEQTIFAREKLKSNVVGKVWTIKIPNEEQSAYVAVDKGKVKAIYVKPTWFNDNMLIPIQLHRYDKDLAQVIRSAAKSQGWDLSDPKASMTIRPNSQMSTFINRVSGISSVRVRPIPSSEEQAARDFGWITPIKRDNKEVYQLTSTGKAVHSQLRDNHSVSFLDNTYPNLDTLELSDDTHRDIQDVQQKREVEQLANVKPAKVPRTPKSDTPQQNGEQPANQEQLPAGSSKTQIATAEFKRLVAANGTIPTSKDFKAYLMSPPLNMTSAGASTYYHNIKNAHAKSTLGESHLAYAVMMYDNDATGKTLMELFFPKLDKIMR